MFRNETDRKLAGRICVAMGGLTTEIMALLTENERGELLRIRKLAVVGSLKAVVGLVEAYAEDDL